MKNLYIKVFMLGCLVFFHGILGARDANLTRVGEWGTGYYNDVSIKGNYAFCAASYSGLDIIDISSPSLPVKVGNFNNDGFVHRLDVSGNYAYLTNGNELVIVDVSDPALPLKVSHYYTTGQVSDVMVKDNYAYLAVGSYLGYNSLQVIDVSSPSSPFLAGQYDTPVTRNVTGLFVRGSYVYLAIDYGLYIFDITNPAAPQLVGEVGVSWYTVGVVVSGNYAYVSSYYYDSDGAYFGSLDIIDVTNPASPVHVGRYNAEEWEGRSGEVCVTGNYAYFPYGTGAIHIIDVSTPSAPSLVKKYETPGAPDGLAMEGQYVFVADGHGGLQILDASNPANPSPEGAFNHSVYITDVMVKGNYAYAAGGKEGLVIFDVSTPSSPALVSNYELGNWTEEKIFISGTYAYVIPIKRVLDTFSSPPLYIIDISNPHSPSLAGTYRPDSREEIGGIHISGNYAYVLVGSRTIEILNISDPSQIAKAGTYTTSESNSGIWVSGNYAYVTHQSAGVEVIDVSNPSAPARAASIAPVDSPWDIDINGNYAYVIGEKLAVVDISTPASPSLVSTYDYDEDFGSVFRLYAQGNYVYLPNSSSGLRVVDVSNPASPTLAADYYVLACEGVYADGNYVYLAGANYGKLLVLCLEENTTSPQIQLNPGQLQFAGNTSGAVSGPQTIYVSNSGGGTLDWDVSDSDDWIICPAVSGTNRGVVDVSVDTRGLEPGTYTGYVFFYSPNAGNSPGAVEVSLTVHQSSQTSAPFGSFDTPTHGAVVYSSVPFTGWALDDVGVQSVQLFREEPGSLVYIGDAMLVEGARPDVEQAYPDYPNNHKAGWGYMMLTNYLPGQGNGSFTIHAIATDVEGNRVPLGTKTIIADNHNAVKPFGAIDTPAQGGAASGSGFANFGWVLTPLPNTIPKDGSTIRVWVDGVFKGHPVYNNYRADVAAAFPDYNNSDGAVGYFYLDTTQYANGVHTIQWTAVDDAGNTDGIGSRYFTIQNSLQDAKSNMRDEGIRRDGPLRPPISDSTIPIDYSTPVRIKKGYNQNIAPQIIYPDENGVITVEIKELERIELGLAMNVTAAYQVVGQRYRALPWGSFLDRDTGTFTWQPGQGFVGRYRLVFLETDDFSKQRQKDVEVIIRPKY